MAFALRFDGQNDIALTASTVLLTGVFSIKIKFKFVTLLSLRTILGGDANLWIGNILTTNRLGAEVGGLMANRIEVPAVVLQAGVDYVATLSRDISNDFVLDLDGNLSNTKNHVGTVSFDTVGAFNSAFFANIEVKSVELIDGATPANNLTLDANASNHGPGTPVLVDIVGTNDATGFNMPTDGSAWIDLGGIIQAAQYNRRLRNG